jgi:ribosomal protein S27AE
MKNKTEEKFPKKICPHCGYVAQMHFDIKDDFKRVKNARCPKCHKPLFDKGQ